MCEQRSESTRQFKNGVGWECTQRNYMKRYKEICLTPQWHLAFCKHKSPNGRTMPTQHLYQSQSETPAKNKIVAVHFPRHPNFKNWLFFVIIICIFMPYFSVKDKQSVTQNPWHAADINVSTMWCPTTIHIYILAQSRAQFLIPSNFRHCI